VAAGLDRAATCAGGGPGRDSAYLGVFGPATPERFDAWLTQGASKKAAVRSWFADLGDRLATVEVDGKSAFLLASDVDDLGGTSPTQTVRLLPAFDQYVLGPGTKAEEILAASRRAKVSRTAGWISPVVVAGGRVAGTWELNGDTGESTRQRFPQEASLAPFDRMHPSDAWPEPEHSNPGMRVANSTPESTVARSYCPRRAHGATGPESRQREKNAHEPVAALGPRGSVYRAEAGSAEPPDQ
jgi:Winged helix DNA-binding domain